MACTDTAPVASETGWLDSKALHDVAYAVAAGLASPEARADILRAMRESVRVQHSLVLEEYIGSIAGGRLLRDAALALGLSEAEFRSRVLALPKLEVVVPVREHRLNWAGSGDIGVAGSWDADNPEFTVYDQSGAQRRARDLRALMEYDAFFHVRPQENFGTRIGRQPDVPGPVIQDIDDGETAMIIAMREAGAEPRSVDVGRYATESELEAALVEAFGSGGGSSVEDLAADDGRGCVDIHCEDPARGGGGGAVGGWSEEPTFARYWSGMCKLVAEGFGDSSEVEISMEMETADGGHRGHIRLEGLECPTSDPLDFIIYTWDDKTKRLATFSKIADGHRIEYKVVETDALFDDLLGWISVQPEHNKNRGGYDAEEDALVWWDFDLELPNMVAEISW